MMIIFTLFSLLFPALAQPLNDQINVGFKYYQEGQYEQAKEEFKKLFESNKNNSFILYNLGLAEYKLGNIGLALGLWHRASEIKPDFKEPLSAIAFAEENLDIKPETHEPSGLLDTVRHAALPRISPHLLYFVTILFLFLSWRGALSFLVSRKQALKENLPTPHPSVSFYVYSSVFLITLFLTTLKVYENALTRGVVIAKKLEAKTGPNLDQVTLFVLTEGTRVIIKEKQRDWYKIETPREKIGWVSSENVFIISEN